MNSELINQVKKLNITLNKGCTNDQLEDLEKALGYKLPEDFLKFYSFINGYAEDCSFERQRIWDSERIISEFLDYNDEYIRFSDYVLNAPWIGISKKDDKIHIGAGFRNEFDGETDIIANNFTEFIELIVINSDKLY